MRKLLKGLSHYKITYEEVANVLGIPLVNNGDDKITDAPNLLWHYTSLDAFQKIMSSGVIFATYYAFLNDYDEIQAVSKAIAEELKSRVGRNQNQYFRDFCSYIDEYFPISYDIENIGGEGQEKSSYIISLTEMEDSIPHWKEYTQDWGVSIGFKVKKGVAGFSYLSGKADSLNRCLYYSDVETLAHAFIDKIEDFLNIKSVDIAADKLEEFTRKGMILENGLKMIPYLKQRSYTYEGEWRYVCAGKELGNSNSQSRELDYCGYKPVIKVPLGDLFDGVEKVLVRPGKYQKESASFCNFLRNHIKQTKRENKVFDATHFKVECSKKSLRF